MNQKCTKISANRDQIMCNGVAKCTICLKYYDFE